MKHLHTAIISACIACALHSANAAEWQASQSYSKGDTADYQGKIYTAKWWTQGEKPGQSWGAWQEVTAAGNNEWQSNRAYQTGEQVQYAGQLYQARWWTQGEVPTLAGNSVWQNKGPAEAIISGMAAVHSHGRVVTQADHIQYSWPGVYFDGRFRGDKIGVKFDDPLNSFDILIDGQKVKEVAAPGKSTIWIDQLSAGEHSIRVAKRSESPQTSGRFFGFEAGAGGKLLTPNPAKRRQIEFIGDSFTLGYASTSGKQSCTQAEIAQSTNTNVSFGVLTANQYQADYQINAYSGLGMIRNYNGNLAPSNFRSYYDLAIPSDAQSVWQNNGLWKPQVVVIGLGINDFNTPVHASEAWSNDSRKAEYKAAYQAFIAKLRQQYGNDTLLVLSATPLWQVEDFIPAVQEVITERRALGDANIEYFGYGNLDFLACDWHPSVKDHQGIAAQLTTLIESKNLNW